MKRIPVKTPSESYSVKIMLFDSYGHHDELKTVFKTTDETTSEEIYTFLKKQWQNGFILRHKGQRGVLKERLLEMCMNHPGSRIANRLAYPFCEESKDEL